MTVLIGKSCIKSGFQAVAMLANLGRIPRKLQASMGEGCGILEINPQHWKIADLQETEFDDFIFLGSVGETAGKTNSCSLSLTVKRFVV